MARILTSLLALLILGTAGAGLWLLLREKHDPPPARLSAPPSLPTATRPLNVPPRPEPTGVLPAFRVIGPESGLRFERFDDATRFRRILEVNGGGVALLDFDRDGRLDIFFTNGCRLPPQADDHSTECRFFRNQGHLRFDDVTDDMFLHRYGFNYGCAVGDYDADGFDDLYVASYGQDSLWHGNGDGTFSEVTPEAGIDVPAWGSSAAFGDVNGDGALDLYVANYVAENAESPTLCPNPESPDGYIACPPAKYEGTDDVLLLSDGSGGFLDVTAEAGMTGLHGKGLGVVICDLDFDGAPEIYVANDGQANFLFDPIGPDSGDALGGRTGVEPGELRFADRALAGGSALNEAGLPQASMGIAAADYDRNGTIDLFLTHFYGDTNTLYVNLGDLNFEDATRRSGVGPCSRKLTSWGTVFIDWDNDGWPDLVTVNGHVEDRAWHAEDEAYQMRPLLLRNERDGTLFDVTPWGGEYFTREWLGRGLAAGDLDRDGLNDLVVSHMMSPSVGLHNETITPDRSVALRLVGTTSVRNGYGVRVRIADEESGVYELVGGGSYQSANSLELFLGIGQRRSVTIDVIWPSGIRERFPGVIPGVWGIVEGRGRIVRLETDNQRQISKN